MSCCGIYQILCVPTGKKYIGSSKDIQDRWRAHRYLLGVGRHSNRYLQAAWDKYGVAAFEFSIIQECAPEDQKYLEQLFMDIHLSYDRKLGFNLSIRADVNCMPLCSREKLSESLKNHYAQLRLTGHRHAEHYNVTMTEARKEHLRVVNSTDIHRGYLAKGRESWMRTRKQIMEDGDDYE